jgi:hypothetical protein
MVAWTSSGERPWVFTALSESSEGLPTGNRMADRDGHVLRPACHRADGRSFGTAIDRCDPVEHDGDDFPRTRSATVESMNSTQSHVPDRQSGKTGSSQATTTSLGKDVRWGLACTCLRRAYTDVDIGRSVMGDCRSGIARVCHHLPDSGLQPLLAARLGISPGPQHGTAPSKTSYQPEGRPRARVARKSGGRHRKLSGGPKSPDRTEATPIPSSHPQQASLAPCASRKRHIMRSSALRIGAVCPHISLRSPEAPRRIAWPIGMS